MKIQTAHTENAPAESKSFRRILVMGPAARRIASALLRLEGKAEIAAADTASEAVALLNTGAFDHLLIDNRSDGALTLTIPKLVRMGTIENIIVLAGPKSKETLEGMPGIGSVITAPYNPLEIASSLDIDVKDSRRQEAGSDAPRRRSEDAVGAAEKPTVGEYFSKAKAAFETDDRVAGAVSVASRAGDQVSRRFSDLIARLPFTLGGLPNPTALFSMLYKNLALGILAALFIAFVSYGIMIGFFLTSTGWSSPLQLQRGHELVIKAERERGELKVKRNLVTRQLADAENRAKQGRAAITRAAMLEQIAHSTLDQEIENRKNRRSTIGDEIQALEDVLKSYGSAETRKRDREMLHRDYKNRIMTRRIYEQSLIRMAEIETKVVNLREQISYKKNEAASLEQGISYLGKLRHSNFMEDSAVNFDGGRAEFVPISNQVIEVQQLRTAGEADIAEFKTTKENLSDSITVLNQSLAELEATPMIKALEKPVNVLFVPYTNLENYEEGRGLYTCAIAIFWCSQVGTTGSPLGGEITTTHPFFGKPIRGQFVEANLTETSAAQKEIIHVGRPPLFF